MLLKVITFLSEEAEGSETCTRRRTPGGGKKFSSVLSKSGEDGFGNYMVAVSAKYRDQGRQ